MFVFQACKSIHPVAFKNYKIAKVLERAAEGNGNDASLKYALTMILAIFFLKLAKILVIALSFASVAFY